MQRVQHHLPFRCRQGAGRRDPHGDRTRWGPVRFSAAIVAGSGNRQRTTGRLRADRHGRCCRAWGCRATPKVFLHLDDFLRVLQTRHLAFQRLFFHNDRVLALRTTALGQTCCRTATVLPAQKRGDLSRRCAGVGLLHDPGLEIRRKLAPLRLADSDDTPLSCTRLSLLIYTTSSPPCSVNYGRQVSHSILADRGASSNTFFISQSQEAQIRGSDHQLRSTVSGVITVSLVKITREVTFF